MSDDNDNPQNNEQGDDGAPAAGPATDANALAAASEATAAATARADASTEALLTQTRTANPSIPPDLITGATAEEIAASVTAGQATVDQVIAANPPDAKARPPGDGAGAPPRIIEPPADTRGSARIAWALNNQPKE